ncbi:anaerobic dimethyl sulfoxide reductase subunit C [Klebsiella pneumoniae]|nr:dimethyl sulfoxide reductase anchor subunit family protein [Klebsiella pneumoniae]MCJ4421363.1 dimethyl sulfoxide reductase anchor subunit [Klebsiella pneumoniae]MCJ4442895.1 dimethyl sulfoxide reductase anchor subunit [Klebsiella pneumoniae]MCJ4459285.1 dimethyl sulfoxide reductase anchor subunit [Klebsiella pneumoniae]MCP6101067.1 dimethyl sulfoxide reductase anchor subunit [Klebsiella pneumoniae]MCP6254605.1 dimethyl sulfoxide reductase anchor subunit [Klebsiella pneumoniae]
MGNGWHEWPLMVFTVFGQCVVGGFIVLALALMTGKLSREQEQRVVGSMFGLWVLMGIGFIASTMHLGSPLRAFNSLNRVGASSLSNEIASGAIFFAVGGIGWLLAVCKKLPAGLRSLWLVVTMVLGVIFVWMMVRVYNTIDTVPTWYTVWTPLSFFLTLFIGGPLLGYLLLRVAGVDGWALRLLPVVSLLALLVSIMVVVMQGSELATIRSSVQQASALVPDYGLLMAWRVVLLALALALALACWCVPQIRGRKPAVSLLGLAFVLILAGEMIGRGVFYGLHMTVGMAVAS